MKDRLRIGFALAGFAVGAASVALDDHRLGWAAIALLLVSFILRLSNRRGEQGTE